MTLSRRFLLAAPALLPLSARADDLVLAGVSGPTTGQGARYGSQWKRGFDLALQTVDNLGGAAGRPLQYLFQDTQSDAQRAAASAQAFVADPRVVIALGGDNSPAASSIYQAAGMTQIALAASDAAVTQAGNHIWSYAPGLAEQQSRLWAFAAALGLQHPAVLFPDTDAGRSAKNALAAAAKADGALIAAEEGYAPAQEDFRPTLTRVGNANPDGLVLLSDYADAALICHQARDSGYKLPILAGAATVSSEFLALGGAAAEGVFVLTTFFAGDSRPEAQDFIKQYRSKYSLDPDASSAVAYDAMVLFSRLVQGWGPTREAMQKGLEEIKDVPSVVYGPVAFDPQTRRVLAGAPAKRLVVRNNRFTLWDGTRPA